MSKNGEIYTTGKNFTLPPGLTGWTNSTSGRTISGANPPLMVYFQRSKVKQNLVFKFFGLIKIVVLVLFPV